MSVDKMIKEYLLQVQQKIQEKEKVFIYGAGTCGKLLAKFMHENQVKVDGFCVTDAKKNQATLGGLPVVEFQKIQADCSTYLFLMGIRDGTSTSLAIQKILESVHANFLPLPIGFFDHVLNDDMFSRPLIQVTPKLGCSVNCHFCPQSVFIEAFSKKKRKNMMSLGEFMQCIDKTPKSTIIEFAGFVEPFLNPEAADMILYVAKTGREVSLFTTLVGMDEVVWEKIKEIPFRKVVLHLPDIKQYANIPMTDTYFSILKKMIVQKKPDGSSFIDLVNSQADIHPKVMEIVSGKVLIWGGDLIDRAGNLEIEDARGAFVEEGPIYCKTAAHVDHNILLPDGSLVLCCMDFGMQHVIGNLLEDSYEDIMNGEIITNIRRRMKSKRLDGLLCKNCTNAIPIKGMGVGR